MTTHHDEGQELSMSDGQPFPLAEQPPGNDLLKQARDASLFLGNNLHEQFVRDLAEHAAVELGRLMTWVTALAAPSERSVTLGFADRLEFNAKTGCLRSNPRSCSITMSLGVVRMLLGAANKLAQVETYAGYGGEFFVMRAFEDWSPTQPIGMLCVGGTYMEDTFRIALDAIALLFFHEVGHAFCDHLAWDKSDLNVSKAAEAEADIMAGYLFGNAPTGWDGAGPQTDKRRIERAVRASEALHVWLQALSARSGSYHLPPNRVECMVQGLFRSSVANPWCAEWVNDLRWKFLDLYRWAPERFASWDHARDPAVKQDRSRLERHSYPFIAKQARIDIASRAIPGVLLRLPYWHAPKALLPQAGGKRI